MLRCFSLSLLPDAAMPFADAYAPARAHESAPRSAAARQRLRYEPMLIRCRRHAAATLPPLLY